MIQSEYALSYNVKKAVIDILESIREYDTITQMNKFVSWFNKLINQKGRVTMVEICDKLGIDSIEAFSRVGFNSEIEEDDIYEFFRTDGSKFYRILFPVLRDFTIKERLK